MKYGSPGKKEIIERIELKTDSAASVVIELLEEDLDPALKSILGVVALIGTTPTLELSRCESIFSCGQTGLNFINLHDIN